MKSKALSSSVVLALVLAAGCYTTPAPPVQVVTVPPPPVDMPRPAPRPGTPEELARGFVEAMSEGDLDRAGGYYLSREEFDALFEWRGAADPADKFGPRNINDALQRVAGTLRGARFIQLAEAPSPATLLERGQNLDGPVLRRDTQGIDGVTALVEVNGVTRRVRLEGLLDAGGYWRLFFPIVEIR